MTPAGAADCERAAIRAYLFGADDESAKHWEEAARSALTAGDHAEAARYAFWLGLSLMMRGLEAPASGWFTRAEELSTKVGRECPASVLRSETAPPRDWNSTAPQKYSPG